MMKKTMKRTTTKNRTSQIRFQNHVKCVVNTLLKMDNSVLDDDLQSIDTHIIAGEIAEKRMRSLESLGNIQYSQYMKNRIIAKNVSIFEPIKRNSVKIFGGTAPPKSKQVTKLSMAKSDTALFSKLYIAHASIGKAISLISSNLKTSRFHRLSRRQEI